MKVGYRNSLFNKINGPIFENLKFLLSIAIILSAVALSQYFWNNNVLFSSSRHFQNLFRTYRSSK